MKKKISIEGMSCGHCVNHVKEALGELKGMKDVDVNLSAQTAIIDFEGNLEDKDIKCAIEDAGYEVMNIVEP